MQIENNLKFSLLWVLAQLKSSTTCEVSSLDFDVVKLNYVEQFPENSEHFQPLEATGIDDLVRNFVLERRDGFEGAWF